MRQEVQSSNTARQRRPRAGVIVRRRESNGAVADSAKEPRCESATGTATLSANADAAAGLRRWASARGNGGMETQAASRGRSVGRVVGSRFTGTSRRRRVGGEVVAAGWGAGRPRQRVRRPVAGWDGVAARRAKVQLPAGRAGTWAPVRMLLSVRSAVQPGASPPKPGTPAGASAGRHQDASRSPARSGVAGAAEQASSGRH